MCDYVLRYLLFLLRICERDVGGGMVHSLNERERNEDNLLRGVFDGVGIRLRLFQVA